MSQSDRSRQEGQAEGAVVSIKEPSPLEQALREGTRPGKCFCKRLKPR
jgi:hypothetical protein